VSEQCRLHSEIAAAGRLDELDVPEAILRNAVQSGLEHAFACTYHDPPSLPGIITWGKTVRHLRDALVTQGWKPDSTRNYATVVSPNEAVAIAVAAGDAATGRESTA